MAGLKSQSVPGCADRNTTSSLVYWTADLYASVRTDGQCCGQGVKCSQAN